MGKDNKGNGGFALCCCFAALGVAAVIACITSLLPLVADVSLGDKTMGILQLVLMIVMFIGVLFGAFAFAGRHGALVKILTVIFVLVFVVAIVLSIVGIVEIGELGSLIPGASV